MCVIYKCTYVMYKYVYVCTSTCVYINMSILRALVVGEKIRGARERPSHILTQSNSLLLLTYVQRAFFTKR